MGNVPRTQLERTIAVGEDGRYYSLLVPDRVTALVTGVRPEPERPRMIIGEGGRDGESIPLRQLLSRILDEGRRH